MLLPRPRTSAQRRALVCTRPTVVYRARCFFAAHAASLRSPSGDDILGRVHARFLWLGFLLAGCSMDNPGFGLGDSLATSGDSAAATTSLPTSPTTGDPSTGNSGSLTATSGDPSTTAAMTGEETGPPPPDLGAVCGNGKLDASELCDDGNDTPADGCERNCRPMFEVVEVDVFKDPRDLQAADFDGDGKVDLVVAHLSGVAPDPEYTILLNKGGGQLEAHPRDIPLYLNIQSVLVGQLAGDPRPDLLLINKFGFVLVAENMSEVGVVKFTPQPPLQAVLPVQDRGSTLADLNNDGLDDLLVVTSDAKLYTYVRTPNGFKIPAVYPLGLTMPVAVAAGQLLLGDPGPQVVVAHNVAGSELTPLLNDGLGNLSPMQPLQSHCQTGAAGVATGDGDQFGSRDLVVACASNLVTLAGQDAEGEFIHFLAASVQQFAGAGTLDIYGDDTWSDVFGVSSTDSAVVVWVQSAEEFPWSRQEVLSAKPSASVVADIDADGAPDLAVVLPEAFKIGLLLNQTRKE